MAILFCSVRGLDNNFYDTIISLIVLSARELDWLFVVETVFLFTLIAFSDNVVMTVIKVGMLFSSFVCQ